MKIWVISGERRKVGKTYLANRLAETLPNALAIKIGHHPPREGKPSHYFTSIEAFLEFQENLDGVSHLIVESNRLALQRFGDLQIYLPSPPNWDDRRTDAPALEQAVQIVLHPKANPTDWPVAITEVLEDRDLVAPILAILDQQRRYLAERWQ